jgi:predicted phosphoribosyltransferase
VFRNRQDAAFQLVQCFKGRVLCDPLVLAIPKGGVLIGAVVARELDAELDIVQAAKLRAPCDPCTVVGAVSECGDIYLHPRVKDVEGLTESYVKAESGRQLATISHRRKLIDAVRPPATVAGRSVIVTDDGIATGSTMVAVLQCVKAKRPFELLVAVPVASMEGLELIRPWCDEHVSLVTPEVFRAIDEFYEGFPCIDDARVLDVLRDCAQNPGRHRSDACGLSCREELHGPLGPPLNRGPS